MATSETVLERLRDATTAPVLPNELMRVLTDLLEILASDERFLSNDNSLETTAFGDPFPFTRALFPLLGSVDGTVKTAARKAVASFANHSSAKEMIMALNERLTTLCHDADSDNDGDFEEEQTSEPSSIIKQPREELSALVEMCTAVLPRIQTKRPATFLSSTCDAIESALNDLAETGAFVPNDEQPSKQLTTADAVDAISDFASALLHSPWIPKEDSLPALRHLLLSSMGLLHPYLPLSIARSFVTRMHPQYATTQTCPPRSKATSRWRIAVALASNLGLDSSALLSKATARPEDDGDVVTATGAFVLLTHAHALDGAAINLSPVEGDRVSGLLVKFLPMLRLALGSASTTPTAEDEALYMMWWLVTDVFTAGESLDDDVAFWLVELLGATASLSPQPDIRFAAFRLLTDVVLQTDKEEVQLMIVKDLLQDCPYEPMRVAAISLLRQILSAKLADPTRLSLFLSPLLLTELPSTLAPVLPADQPGLSDSDATRFLERYQRSTMEKLSLIYFLLVADKNDQTRIRATYSVTQQRFLRPLRTRIDLWSRALEGKTGSEDIRQLLDLQMLDTSLARLESMPQNS